MRNGGEGLHALWRRVEALERGERQPPVGLDQLPIAQLLDRFEQVWVPDATSFLLPRSVKSSALATDAVDGRVLKEAVVATYTVATLPAAANHTAEIVFVSDGAAGTKFRGSDGTAWVNLG